MRAILLFVLFAAHGASAQTDTLRIPIGGNTWSYAGQGKVSNDGITDWKEPQQYTVYVRFSHPGKIHVGLELSVPEGASTIEVHVHHRDVYGTRRFVPPVIVPGLTVKAAVAALHTYDVGGFAIDDTGYYAIDLQGLKKTGAVYANVSAIDITGADLKGNCAYVPTNDGNFFYWGRRGPSVHLSYAIPKDERIQWFYNEVTVPEGQDVQGSYFMADGFSVGYFGMQVNSPTERHILFSVWSPFHTDNPNAIPDSLRIRLLKKGDGVHAGSFGNEGSGGQSYLNYMWKAGNTYRFLLEARPADSNRTDFTAWFYAPEEGHWRLIAGFSRPQTHSWLTGLHSFLENFDPEAGDETRYVLFNRQWIADSSGRWTPIRRARFTGDNTARKGYRLDYAGGVLDGAFFLKNAGFFSDRVPLDTWFERPAPATEAPPRLPAELP